MSQIAVVGAGWAGVAAALTLARAGLNVTVFEAGKIAGGRARQVEHDGRCFDNGQHLLLGAYERSISLIRSLHSSIDQVVLRQPLSLSSAPCSLPSLSMRAPRIKAPLHLLAAMISARGLSLREKVVSAAWAATQMSRKPIVDTATVSELLSDQPEAARELLWEPLCVAALNTPPNVASARVFVEVLRRAFNSDHSASDLIIPRVDLSRLLPIPALAEVSERGGTVKLGTPVLSVRPDDTRFFVCTRDADFRFDHVVLATGPQHVARVLSDLPQAHVVAERLRDMQYEPITTLLFEFLHAAPCPKTGMLLLDGNPGQWLFWQQHPSGHWLASVVISAHHRTRNDTDLTAEVLAQLRRSYSLPMPAWQFSITEKRATYACTPVQTALLRVLPHRIGNLRFAGDWCFPELPATLEAAVISGESAARSIIEACRHG